MSLRRLALKQAWSHPIRAVLTILAVTVAMYLFCFLRSVLRSLDVAVEAAATRRIITTSAVSLFQVLPRTYRDSIASIDGVESVSPFTWFGGLYRDESGRFAQFASDLSLLLKQYPEVVFPEAQREALLLDPRGALVGSDLAARYDWHVGDQIPIIGTIYARVDGSAWSFTIQGIYHSTRANVDEQTMYFHASYLRETLDQGLCYGPKGTGVFLVKVAPDATGEEVADRIDAYFEGGPQRTRTQTEAAFQADFVNMLGNLPTFLGLIVGAVLFAILFGVVNTMTIAARERTRTVGILKSLGFPDAVPARLFAFESTFLLGVGTVLGIALAVVTEGYCRRWFGSQIPGYHVALEVDVQAAVIGITIAILAALVPALAARRLRPVEALRLEA